MSPEMDPSLLQDFLAESAELIDQLDADLVKLESSASPDAARELCNGCFRALHTIKGAAGFLALTPVTAFAHAAEDALNHLRKGEVQVTPAVMDALLQSADVVRAQIEALASGAPAPGGPADLIERLNSLAEPASAGVSPAPPPTPPPASPTPDAASDAADTAAVTNGGDPDALDLPPQKLDLVEFMAADLRECGERLRDTTGRLADEGTRGDAAQDLTEIADSLVKTTEFFEMTDLTRCLRAVLDAAAGLAGTQGDLGEAAGCLVELGRVVVEQAEALGRRRLVRFAAEDLLERWGRAVTAGPVEATSAGAESGAAGPQAAKASVEQTVRVEVGRLESLLNLVGQLVLNKNRVLALTRRLGESGEAPESAEQLAAAAGDLDRLMGELQVGVMRTRMQPLAKLFDRYPRVIRDMARVTQKRIHLEITGRDTEVDKTVLEQLADPLVHILRNSADHGIEAPAARLAAGKPEAGTIRLSAEHRGSHVRVAVTDDGKGLDPAVIGRKAVEKGLVTADALAQMPERDVLRLIFEPGFSTAEAVTDLSGRGVGMDVVLTNIRKLSGTIDIESEPGRGATIEVLIPLTVAIMPAMIVGVQQRLYAIPLQCIAEIVRPERDEVHTVAGQPVMRRRDTVLPLVDLRPRLGEAAVRGGRCAEDPQSRPLAVVVGADGRRAGLMVDRLVGRQEIVIKPLDDPYTRGGPFSGATIGEDGEVSLILDVPQLVRPAELAPASADQPDHDYNTAA